MKGTFNILSYVINEYLIEYAKSNIALSELDGAKVAVEALQKHI